MAQQLHRQRIYQHRVDDVAQVGHQQHFCQRPQHRRPVLGDDRTQQAKHADRDSFRIITLARDPSTAGPFSATTGHSRQNTPMGESFRIISMAFMQISLATFTAAKSVSCRSLIRISAKPMNSEATMICSMFASTKGLMKLDGKMPTSVSMKFTDVADGS